MNKDEIKSSVDEQLDDLEHSIAYDIAVYGIAVIIVISTIAILVMKYL